MARARNRDAVLKTLRKALDEDRTKTFVVEISPLGLVEMTRQNVTDGVREIMTKPCPTCGGEGVVKSEETIAIEVERRLRELVDEAGADGAEAYLVRMNPKVTALLHRRRRAHAARARGGDRPLLPLHGLRGPAARPLRDRRWRARAAEIEEQSVPFREGEEVHVDIVEPHMYSEDDAVAKVDGYLIDGRRRRSRTWARRCSCGSRRPAAPRRAPSLDRRRSAEEAAAATEERRKARERAAKRAGAGAQRARRARAGRAVAEEAEAVETLADDDEAVHAGTGPAAVAEADEDAAKPAASPRAARGRSPPRRSARAGERRRPRRRGDERGARPRRTATTRYNRSLGAAAAEADGAVRVRRPTPTAPKSPKPASDLSPCPKPRTPSSRPAASSTASRRGTTFLVERLTADEGATVDLEPLLYASGDESLFGADARQGLGPGDRRSATSAGPKIRIFKFKPKRGYKRTRRPPPGAHAAPGRRGIREGELTRWHTRRASAPAATAATPTPSASA